jgi:S-adenosylmethionine-diacylgycerolhomoserine-N-methlytransferase
MPAAPFRDAMIAQNHAALMDSIYHRQRHIYDFTRKYYLFGRDTLIDSLEPKPGARILEVGCGTARNLVRLAKLYPGRKFFGLDASEAMLETASRTVETAGLGGQIRLAHAYAADASPGVFGETAPFDDIVFSYSLSMIPDWKQALRVAAMNLSPDGRIHVVDFGDLRSCPGIARRALLGWLRLFHVQPRVELLETLEQDSKKFYNFQLLTGRYAFILSSSANGLAGAALSVA